MRGGASPIEAIEIVLLSAAGGFGGRQLERLQDRLFDAAVNWVLRHRRKEHRGSGNGGAGAIAVTLYGADGSRACSSRKAKVTLRQKIGPVR
jgi:hypothetical protein